MWGSSNTNRTHESIPPKLKPAFDALLEAFDYADDTSSDLWDFAVAMRQLQELGLCKSDLRWLVRKGYALHAQEVTKLEDEDRNFLPTANLSFCKKTCFVLTEAGRSVAHAISDLSPAASSPVNDAVAQNGKHSRVILPHWDPETRELRIDGVMVKRFKWQAVNQEIVLSAFQEDGWPTVIDDPLPPKPEHDPKCRLHDTIKALNRNQEHAVIRFHGNGTGEGIRWEIVENDDAEN